MIMEIKPAVWYSLPRFVPRCKPKPCDTQVQDLDARHVSPLQAMLRDIVRQEIQNAVGADSDGQSGDSKLVNMAILHEQIALVTKLATCFGLPHVS